MKLLLLIFAFILPAAAAGEAPTSPVGMRAEWRDLILPGPELEPKPLEPGAPIVVRVTSVRLHGDAFRYDLDYYGLEAGDFDLVDYLRPKDGAERDPRATAPVTFTAVLAADRITPNEPTAGRMPRVGGYKTLLVLAGILWLAVLVALIFYRRNKPETLGEIEAQPKTLADRLRPLVESARDGTLDKTGQADLERTLLGFWREKLDLADESPATALAKLRDNAEAAPLLAQLEKWLHSPSPESPDDIDALLAPYRGTLSS